MELSLINKNAVICGSSQGIGLAAAIELASLGANCILLARNAASLEEALLQLPNSGAQKHSFKVADFLDTAAVQQAIHEITNEVTVEILVNNSGGPKPGPITSATDEDFLFAFKQHVINNQNLANAVIPGMNAKNYGRIINIISTSIRTPLSGLGVSNTIRAAVASWAKTLSNEIGQFNITVNGVLPGLTETARLSSLISTTASTQHTDEEKVKAGMINSIPMKRFAKPAEVANVIGFLASPAASYVTGVTIPVDGGRTPTI